MKFENINQLEKGKLYLIELRNGQKTIVFRDKDGIRSNAQKIDNGVFEPVVRFKDRDIASFEEITN